jgi:hypothetical protein
MEKARTLTNRLAELLARERTALAEFLVALAAFDAKRVWLALGYGSLFDFLHRELGLSKGAAFYRKAAVELIQRFPEIVEPLRDGRLCLMSVAEVARVLTPENRDEVLPRFFRLSKREAQVLAASLAPRENPPLREVVTAVRTVVAPPALAFVEAEAPGRDLVLPVEPERPSAAVALGGESTADAVPAEPPSSAAQARTPPTTSEPLTAELSRLHVTVSRRFLEKLEKARAALSHSLPGGGAEEILEAGLDLVIERHEKRRGIVERPRREPPPSKPEHVPAHVKRAVWKRDGGRCQWPLEGGGVCGSTRQVELDHVTPRGRGGLATVEGMRCLCRPHNSLAARQAYGDEWMDRFMTGPGRRSEQAAPAR